MIDTTTVNYAIDKLTAGWQAAAPTIANVSEKYIHFIVIKTCVPQIVLLLIVILSGILCKKLIHKLNNFDGEYAEILAMCCLITGIITVISTLIFTIELPNVVLAIACPEMFTIHQILGK